MKRILYYTLALASVSLLNACMEDPGTSIKWESPDPIVQFDGFTSLVRLYTKVEDGEPVNDFIKISVIPSKTGRIEEDIQVALDVELIGPDNYSGPPAYEIPSSVTIPAGSYSANIPVTIFDDDIDSDTLQFSVRVKIASTSKGIINPNFSQLTFNFSICPSAVGNLLGGEGSALYECVEESENFGPYDPYGVIFERVDGNPFGIRIKNYYDFGISAAVVANVSGCSYDELDFQAAKQPFFGSLSAEIDGVANNFTRIINTEYKIYNAADALVDEGTQDYSFVQAPAPNNIIAGSKQINF